VITRILKAIYEMIIKHRMIDVIHFWGIYDEWNEINEVQGRICKKILGIPCYAANGTAQMELDIDGMSRKLMHLTLKYQQRILHIIS
jgi:hypothetical protein